MSEEGLIQILGCIPCVDRQGQIEKRSPWEICIAAFCLHKHDTYGAVHKGLMKWVTSCPQQSHPRFLLKCRWCQKSKRPSCCSAEAVTAHGHHYCDLMPSIVRISFLLYDHPSLSASFPVLSSPDNFIKSLVMARERKLGLLSNISCHWAADW